MGFVQVDYRDRQGQQRNLRVTEVNALKASGAAGSTEDGFVCAAEYEMFLFFFYFSVVFFMS